MCRNFARSLPAFAEADILVVPGRGGSGPEHWQSHFERGHANARRVEQDDWDQPDIDAWARRIAAASRERDAPVLAVAHSFGCLALARAAQCFDARIDAALLVAPADPARFAIPDLLVRGRLGFPSLLIASDNDPWLRAWQARELATSWSSGYLNLGLVGHINIASGFGKWPAVDQFVETLWRQANDDRANPILRSHFLKKAAWALDARAS